MFCANAETGNTNASAEIALLNQTVTEVFTFTPGPQISAVAATSWFAACAAIGRTKPQLRSYWLVTLTTIERTWEWVIDCGMTSPTSES
jgi:hypothetical protein